MNRLVAVAFVALLFGLFLGLGYSMLRPPAPQAERVAAPSDAVGGAVSTRAIRLASAYSSSSPLLGARAQTVASNIQTLTQGSLQVTFTEPNAPVAPGNVIAAVAAGETEAGWVLAARLAEEDTAFSFFWGIPFGPRATEFVAWINHGGGRELMVELFATRDLMPLVCGLLPAEGGGWFRKQIRSIEDLRDQKFRISGLGSQVLRKIGVETLDVPAGDVYMGLQNGAIDAAEFSVPSVDLRFSFFKTAQHYYLPGWHQPLTVQLLLFNRAVWEALTDAQRSAVEVSCGDAVMRSIAEGETLQPQALRAMQEKGVQVHTWPPNVLMQLDRAWQQVVAEQAEANPNFKKILESYSAFRENYALWRMNGYLR